MSEPDDDIAPVGAPGERAAARVARSATSRVPRGNIVERVIGWLRAGYPQGVPQGDYIALLGILHRSLTADEVAQIAADLRENHNGDDGRPARISDERIREFITQTVHEVPSLEDVRRVADHLKQGGWPVDPPPEPDDAA